MSESFKHTNRLIHSSSPYLLQHAHNPVDWWEWCDEAFEKAKQEDKLVLVSIGYSACHWCHVMEHECFEKEDTAAIMNTKFVCIKVDREERPDIDQIYMDAVQLLTGRGGWPLNCFLLPDGRPLHGGTYFPKQQWEHTLETLSAFYLNSKEEALTYATNLTHGIKQLNLVEHEAGAKISFPEIESVLNTWSESFDKEWGGFTWSPKFPMPVNLTLFLQYGVIANDAVFTEHIHLTLSRMADGGLFDQAGGGFARYSTDAFWKVPHFEKMLYDNAQLLSIYAQAFSHSGNKKYQEVIHKTDRFLTEELMSEEGLFYSALDADSEGVEGKFYIWTKAELIRHLGENEGLFSLYYSIEESGNWEEGENILFKTRKDEELETLTGKSIREIEEVIQECHRILLFERNKRERPGLDDKIITSWNALLIKGYADCYQATGEVKYLTQAKTIADVLWNKLLADETLFRIYKNGKRSIPGFAEDYASYCEGLMALYEVSGEEQYASRALQIMESCIDLFYDPERKLFSFTSKKEGRLVAEKFDVNDDVIPSSNSMLAKCLLKLGYLFSRPDFHEMGDEMMHAVIPKIKKYPTLFGNWFQLLLWKEKGFHQWIITGENAILPKEYLPNSMICLIRQENTFPLLLEKPVEKELKYYLCKDKVCSLPIGTEEEAILLFRKGL